MKATRTLRLSLLSHKPPVACRMSRRPQGLFSFPAMAAIWCLCFVCPAFLVGLGNRLTDFISIKVRGPLAERCAAFAWKGCKLAAVGDFETITFEDEPERQPGFLIKATEVEFLSPRKAEEEPQALHQPEGCEAA